jgi:hypothetical protein
MNERLEIFGRKRSWSNLPFDICLYWLRETTKTSVRIAGLRAKI